MTALLEHDNNYVTAKIYNYNLYKCTENGKNIHSIYTQKLAETINRLKNCATICHLITLPSVAIEIKQFCNACKNLPS